MNYTSIADTHYEEILSWNGNNLSRCNKVYDSFNVLLVLSLTDWKDEELIILSNELKLLPDEYFVRIITAPEMYQCLIGVIHGKTEKIKSFLKYSIAVEKTRTGIVTEIAKNKWSANGDYYFSDNNSFVEIPTLVNSIPIDHNSIFARRKMPVASFRPIKYGEACPFTEVELKISYDKIYSAFHEIQRVNVLLANFIGSYVKSIVLRKDLTNAYTFQSSSCNGYIGQMVLLNPHLPHIQIELIAESLVHEAIHSLMWRAEVLTPIIKNPSLSMETVISPWSKMDIHYYTLLQACYVWYGVANFWNKALESRIFCPDRSHELFCRAVTGFKDKDFMKEIDKYSHNLSFGMYEAFLSLADASQSILFL
jgi:hypothetical protein